MTGAHMRAIGHRADEDTHRERTNIRAVRKKIMGLQLDMKRVARQKNGKLQRGALKEAHRVNAALNPLVWKLHGLRPLSALTRIAEAKMDDIDLTAPLVYVRINLKTADAYIGETEDW